MVWWCAISIEQIITKALECVWQQSNGELRKSEAKVEALKEEMDWKVEILGSVRMRMTLEHEE